MRTVCVAVSFVEMGGRQTPAKVHPDMIHYGATKTGQLVVARGLAEMTKGTRVTVNSVLPAAGRMAAVKHI